MSPFILSLSKDGIKGGTEPDPRFFLAGVVPGLFIQQEFS